MPSGDVLPVIVLGAGRGTRMGGPKALMRVAGEAWWVRQLERLGAAGVAPVWVVSARVRAGMEGDARFLKQAWVEADSEAPMFESVRAGVRFLGAIKPRGVFVLPIDVPAARREVWAALAGVGPVSAPVFGGEHGHPVYLKWSFAKELSAAPAGARLDELIADLIQYVPVTDPLVTRNLNTPEAVRAYEVELVRGGATG